MDATLTIEEKATNFDTMCHIERVRNLLNTFVVALLQRGERHDQSKLKSPEVAAFTKHSKTLAAMTYGSAEYEQTKQDMGTALAHHYANNRHHPEHFKNGINDMDLVDLIEMLVDWKAASERHNDGNIRKSIEKNVDRFNLSPQLVRILENTAAQWEGK